MSILVYTNKQTKYVFFHNRNEQNEYTNFSKRIINEQMVTKIIVDDANNCLKKKLYGGTFDILGVQYERLINDY